MKTIRFCVAGTGRAGLIHANNIARNIAGGALAAVAEPNAGAVRALIGQIDGCQLFPSIGEALRGAEFDAVVIGAPTFAHKEIAVAAAMAGKHVFCEKPIALSLAECEEISKAIERSGVLFQIGFMRRYDPSFREAKCQIDQGKVGRVTFVRSVTRGPGLPPEWACDPATSNGMLAEVNSHDFDTVRWLTGSDIAEVFAVAGAFKCPELREKYPGFYDNAAVLLKMANGAIATIQGACPATFGYEARAEVLGTEGLLEIGSLGSLNVVRCRKEEGLVRPHSSSWQSLFEAAYLEEIRAFVDCIRSGASPVPGFEDGRKALAAVIAANRSIRDKQPVEL
ncbi:MAG: Gfo/Idh/MocA family oxidoreductase [Terriglobales bacterium]|jgi:myo-inositol 2-dehydrogenase/D-chiro-inositol 1-dehydrogenase/scyllo-inositol 2-dehydrogenase (NAD+)